jgi:hypothetical protein
LSSDGHEIDEFVQGCSNLRTRPQPPSKDVASIRKWFEDHEKAINDDEQQYITREDLVSVVNQTSTPLRRFLERYVIFQTWCIWLWKKEPPSHLPTHEHENIQYVSERRLSHIVSATVITVGLVMLIVPLWVLEVVSPQPYYKLGIISGFIVLFLGMTAYATAARPFETLAATAG